MAMEISGGKSGQFANYATDVIAEEPPGVPIGKYCNTGFGAKLLGCLSL